MYARELTQAGISCLRVKNSAALHASVRRFNPDVIHTHSSDLLPVSREITRELNIPLIFTCHGLGIPHRQTKIKEADAVIAVGPRILGELRDAGIEQVALIGNGVNLDHFRPGEKGSPFQVAYVGRVDAKKRRGLYELIDAVHGIPRARLLVASNDRPNVSNDTHVRSLGWLQDVAPLLAQSHALFGTGRAIREGMAAGCIPFVLGERYSGMVSPANSHSQGGIPSFAGSTGELPNRARIRLDLIRLMQDDTFRKAQSAWCQEYARKHFSIADIARTTETLYRQAIAACLV